MFALRWPDRVESLTCFVEPKVTRRRAVVDTFAELHAARFAGDINAVCWPRALAGDFREVARLLAPRAGVVVVAPDALRDLALSPTGRVAADLIAADLRRLDELGLDPVLNCITSYPRDERGLPIATHVMSFHADRAPVEVDSWLCTYWGKSSEGLDNDDARKLIDIPAVRRALLLEHAGSDSETDSDSDSDSDSDTDSEDEGFRDFIRDGSFDLHYGVKDGAVPFSFGVGHLWRIAVEWPGCRVPPCLHRAPETAAGDEPRLLLIC